ncbi:G1 family glutamic endopeptidase [Kitasatospora viridis]|uniref:Peptidase A4-like protein n=1 Tax=Kitasatospora viridis TaxID=281105 RepID=A0A561T6Q1_9ACTN|nr:G1 family glutamic endopeptidase [Kitasatospora viridis]TWF82796.1 peptidase A4-like protein [Kitasatospora viridis]
MPLPFRSALTGAVALLTLLGSATPAAADNRNDPNWAGYAFEGTTGSFSRVLAEWVQPSGECPEPDTRMYAASWVGLDGYRGTTVEQTGTTARCSEDGQISYFAWYQMYPDPPVRYADPVQPGDRLMAQVSYLPDEDEFELDMWDWTRRWAESTFQRVPEGHTALRRTAEVVVEDPKRAQNAWWPMTRFSRIDFRNCQVNGSPIGDLPDPLVLTMRRDQVNRARPTRLFDSGRAFQVNWEHS